MRCALITEVIKKPLIQLHTGASDTVSASKTQVGSTFENASGETFNLILNYTKGTEDGLELYIAFPDSKSSTVFRDEAGFESIGAGCLKHVPLYRLFDSSTATGGIKIPIESNGNRYIAVFQKRNGVAAVSGTFELYAEVNVISR